MLDLVCPYCGGLLKESDLFVLGYFACTSCYKQITLNDLQMCNEAILTMTDNDLDIFFEGVDFQNDGGVYQ